MKAAPPPSCAPSSIEPPWASTIPRQIASPRPAPPSAQARKVDVLQRCENTKLLVGIGLFKTTKAVLLWLLADVADESLSSNAKKGLVCRITGFSDEEDAVCDIASEERAVGRLSCNCQPLDMKTRATVVTWNTDESNFIRNPIQGRCIVWTDACNAVDRQGSIEIDCEAKIKCRVVTSAEVQQG